MNWSWNKSNRKPLEVINTSGLAERWGLSTGTLENWRGRRKGPPYIKLGTGRGARVVYKMADIENYERHMKIPTRERS